MHLAASSCRSSSKNCTSPDISILGVGGVIVQNKLMKKYVGAGWDKRLELHTAGKCQST